MKDLNLLFLHNKNKINTKRIVIGKGCYLYQNKEPRLDLRSLRDVLCFINNVNDNTPCNLPIVLLFKDVKGDVKLPLILLECLVYYVLKEMRKSMVCLFKFKTNLYTNYLKISPLVELNHLDNALYAKYIKEFSFSIYMQHYRIVLGKEALETDELSKKYDDISHFLMNNGVSESVADDISEVAIELMGNATEHGDSDCLLDIDIDTSISNKVNNKKYCGINICVLNFSKKLFNDDIKAKITGMDGGLKVHPRYKGLYTAYQYHIKHLDGGYSLEDFFTIAAYQHKISGRQEASPFSGGTGLTKLIKNLQIQSEVYHCYMISGNKCLYFDKKYLEYDNDEWLGFNLSRNFLGDIPASSQFLEQKFYMPGTAYNLTFVIERGH